MEYWVTRRGLAEAGRLIDLRTSAYIDGINHRLVFPNIPESWESEHRRPPLSQHHLSFYQAAHDSGGAANIPHGSQGGADFAVNLDDSASHDLWTDDPDFAALNLTGRRLPDPFANNRFVHATRYSDWVGGVQSPKERIDEHQPITYTIAREILERF